MESIPMTYGVSGSEATPYDAAGTSRDLGLNAQAIQQVAKQYVRSRKPTSPFFGGLTLNLIAVVPH